MRSPFPGMDPYLEARSLWHGLHVRLLTHISEELQPRIAPRYVAMIEERVLLGPLDDELRPDVNVREASRGERGSLAVTSPIEATTPEIIDAPELVIPHRYVAIREAAGARVVTVIEVLSPRNKEGAGLRRYRDKQEELLLSDVHLVEIDLLRYGRHAVAVSEDRLERSHYRVSVHRSGGDQFEVYRFSVRDSLPTVSIPLLSPDPDVLLPLGEVFRRCYEAGPYPYAVDYARDPDPPLDPQDAAWARGMIEGRV